MKNITKAQLERIKKKGGKVRSAEDQDVSAAPPAPSIKSKPDRQEVVLDTSGVEQAIAGTVKSSEDRFGELMEELKKVISEGHDKKPVAYDLIIKRRSDGLMESIRLEPAGGKDS